MTKRTTPILNQPIQDLKDKYDELYKESDLTKHDREKKNYKRSRSKPTYCAYNRVIPGVSEAESIALNLMSMNREGKGLTIRPMLAAATGKRFNNKFVMKPILKTLRESLGVTTSHYSYTYHIGTEIEIPVMALKPALIRLYKFLEQYPKHSETTVMRALARAIDNENERAELEISRTGYTLWRWYHEIFLISKGTEEERIKAIADKIGIDINLIDLKEEDYKIDEAINQVVEVLKQEPPSDLSIVSELPEELKEEAARVKEECEAGNVDVEGVSESSSTEWKPLDNSPDGEPEPPAEHQPDWKMSHEKIAECFVSGFVIPMVGSTKVFDSQLVEHSLSTSTLAEWLMANDPAMGLVRDVDVLDGLYEAFQSLEGNDKDAASNLLSNRSFFPTRYSDRYATPRLNQMVGSGTTFAVCSSKVRKLVCSKLPNVVEADLTSCYTSVMRARFEMPELDKLCASGDFWGDLGKQLCDRLPSNLKRQNISVPKPILKAMWYATGFMGGSKAYLSAFDKEFKRGMVNYSRSVQSAINKAFKSIPAVLEIRSTLKTLGVELLLEARANDGWLTFINGSRRRFLVSDDTKSRTIVSFYLQAYEEAIMSYLTVRCWNSARVILSQADGAWLYLLKPDGFQEAERAVSEACLHLFGNANAMGFKVVVSGPLSFPEQVC